jgi:hypothetical protein
MFHQAPLSQTAEAEGAAIPETAAIAASTPLNAKPFDSLARVKSLTPYFAPSFEGRGTPLWTGTAASLRVSNIVVKWPA